MKTLHPGQTQAGKALQGGRKLLSVLKYIRSVPKELAHSAGERQLELSHFQIRNAIANQDARPPTRRRADSAGADPGAVAGGSGAGWAAPPGW